MTFDELLAFISSSDRMRMSAVYQPAVIRALISSGGSATVRQLAHALLGEYESQLLYYESILKKMPIPVLRKHGVEDDYFEPMALTACFDSILANKPVVKPQSITSVLDLVISMSFHQEFTAIH